MTSSVKLSRRSFLALTAVAPVTVTMAGLNRSRYEFGFDHVLGTSLDLVVWAENASVADKAKAVVLEEIRRLAGILSTRDPQSEISRFESVPGAMPSAELAAVLAAYEFWTQRTSGVLSIRPEGRDSPRNVDALGKAYIIDRVSRAARSISGVSGGLLNIGGDILAWGHPCEITVANPFAPQDNAPPFTTIMLDNAAVATSGSYARGAHLFDARSGVRVLYPASATVIANDAVTANALATTLCVIPQDEGLSLIERIPGAKALRIAQNGAVARTAGFHQLEMARAITVARRADWPAGYEMNITLTLTSGAPPRGRGGFGGGRGPGAGKRQYVAVWVEDSAGKLVRVLAFWADKERYYAELSSFFRITGGTPGAGMRGPIRGGPRGQSPLAAMARATRGPGKYELLWDGLDQEKNPVPAGAYRIVVETSQEHGAYAKQMGTIECLDKPADLTLSATSNFEPVAIHYGPRPKSA